MDISSLSTEELSSAQETFDQVNALLDAANYMVSTPDAFSKEDALVMLNTLTSIMSMIVVAGNMVVDVELISRPPITQ